MFVQLLETFTETSLNELKVRNLVLKSTALYHTVRNFNPIHVLFVSNEF
jgi:hypothetical protein